MEQADFDAMVRRYVAKIAGRYAPVAAALLVLVLVLILVPTTQPTSSSVGGLSATPGVASGGASTSASGAGSSGVAANGGSSSSIPGTLAAGGSGAAGGAVASGGGAATVSPQAPGVTPPQTAGVSKTGVTCGAGVRQFTWSSHSPDCVPAYNGNNGGATAQGVTGTTITVTYRFPNSAQDSAISALSGSANVNEQAMINDMKTYINFFNTQFELYGRHVVLKQFNGQGDYIDEDQGLDLAAAQADAVTAHDLGSFGDVTFALGSSEAYEQDLANEHVMSFSAAAEPQSWFDRYAPYEWSINGASGTNGITAAAQVVCRRLAGMPAIFAGDTSMQTTKRTFGIIYPENPNYSAEVSQWKADLLSECGVTVAKTVAYAINVDEYTQEALSSTALMKAAHVTTVLCACDPIFPILLTPAASSQAYYPEWFGPDYGDPVSQDYTSSEWSHEIAAGVPSQPATSSEAYHVYELASPHHQPAEEPPTSPPYFYVPYYNVLFLFEGLQAAGPDLTPQTFAQGMFSLPQSAIDPGGGEWVFGQNVYDPVSSFGLVWWNATVESGFDQKKGTYQACNGGQIYTLANLAALGGPGQQLTCFGK